MVVDDIVCAGRRRGRSSDVGVLPKGVHGEVFFDDCSRAQEVDFLELVQGTMFVAQYEAKFTKLSCFSSHMVEDNA